MSALLRSKFSLKKTVAVVCLTAVVCLVSGSRTTVAEEPLERYIEGLKEKGFYDVAQEYLEKSVNSGTITAELRDRLDYEKAEVLLDGLTLVRDRTQRQANLDQAQQLLDGFIKEKQNHSYASMAKKRLGDLLILRAHMAIEKSKSSKTDEEEVKQLTAQARDFYGQALAVLNNSRDNLKAMLERLDPKSADATVKQLRKKYEDEYLRVRLIIGIIPEELADTYPKDSPEWKANLEKAIAEYDDYAKDYRSKPIATRATLYQARCHDKLGNEKEATTFISEVLDQRDEPVFFDLKRDACLLGAKVWFASQPPQYLLAVQKMQPLVDTMPLNQAKNPEWLELQYWLAKGYRGFADDMEKKADKTPEDLQQLKTAEKLAAQLMRFVSQNENKYKNDALKELDKMGIRRNVEVVEQEEPPKSFIEARDRAAAVLADYENDKAAITTLEVTLKTAADADKAPLEDQLKRTRELAQTGPRRALDLLRTALSFIEPDTLKIEIETVLYKVAFCHYTLGEYDKSLVVAEHLMILAPNSTAAKTAAVIGVKSLLQLAAEADKSSTFEVDQLRNLCEEILKIYPAEPVAVEASAAMIQLALRAGNVQEAEDYMQKVPDGTPGKDGLQLKVGYVLYSSLRQGENDLIKAKRDGSKEEVDIKTAEAKHNELRVRAQAYLAAGMNSLNDQNIDLIATYGTLALAQLYADADKMDEAIAVLENPVYGPLALVRNKHPNTEGKYAAGAYETALKAYVGKLGSVDDPAAVTEKARNTMKDLKTTLAVDEAGKNQLIGIYMRMAKNAKTKMDALKTQAEIDAYQQGLVTFLGGVLTEAEDVSILVWVADTYSNFAESAESKNQPDAAKANYVKAAEVYEKILKVGETDKEALSEAQRLGMTRKLALTLGKSGNFAESIKVYTDLLTAKSAIIDVQIEAAQTLQDWGLSAKDPEILAKSMMGTGKFVNPKIKKTENAIWGWGKISQTVIKYDLYRHRFFEARYNLALCRFEYAKLKKDAQQMASAENDILATYRSDPELGGKEWAAKFTQLLKTIQTALGKPAVGFPK